MSDITLSDKQAEALRTAKAWYENDTEHQQVFSIAGYAGTGKSTVVKFLVDDLGLDDGDVVYGTFTGKAAFVLRKKNVPCQTIHSLAYKFHQPSEIEMAKLRGQVEQLEATAVALPAPDRGPIDIEIGQLRQRLREMRQPKFGLNEESAIRDAKLVVLDEVSMVDDKMAADVLSFRKPVLVLGDPGQLPPIKGEGAFHRREPDVMLTEIHRQAAESAVIRVATMARQGEPIPYGQHDEFVWKMSMQGITAEQLLRGGQVICGMNRTRFDLNNAMRRAAGFTGSALPTGPSEKIICLKNRNDLGLLNGMFVELSEIKVRDDDEIKFYAAVTTEEGEAIHGGLVLPIYAGHFLDHQRLDPNRDDRDWRIKRNLVEATYGWAITAHKAQGSSWSNIVVVDDKWGRSREDRNRWLYTAITRAESGLVILD
jgi:exodeoxyribonuclease-5